MQVFKLRITQADIDAAIANGTAKFPCPFDFACERLGMTARWDGDWIILSDKNGAIGHFLAKPLTNSKVWCDYRNAKPKTILFKDPYAATESEE